MNIACLLIPHLPLQAEILRRPDLRSRSVIISDTYGSYSAVRDFSPNLSNVRDGMPLPEALSYARDAEIIESDIQYYDSINTNIIDGLARISSEIERYNLDTIYVGLNGLQDFYGTSNNLIAILKSAIPEGLISLLGLGSNKFLSYVAASSSSMDHPQCIANNSKSFLSTQSIQLLPVNSETKKRLRKFSIRTLGDLNVLQASQIQAQFGMEGNLIWKLSQGIDPRPLIPMKVSSEITESLEFYNPCGLIDGILIGVKILIERILSRSDIKGKTIRAMILTMKTYRGIHWTKRITFKRPTRDKFRILSRIKSVLENLRISSSIESASLTIHELSYISGNQGVLLSKSNDSIRMQEAIKQLHSVLDGRNAIFHIREAEPWSRIPERRHIMVQFTP